MPQLVLAVTPSSAASSAGTTKYTSAGPSSDTAPRPHPGMARTLEVEHVWLAGLRSALEPWAASPPSVVVRPLG